MTPQAVQALLSSLFAPDSAAHFFDEIVGKVNHFSGAAPSAFRRDVLGADPAATILDAHSRLAGHVKIVGTEVENSPAPDSFFESREAFEQAVRDTHARHCTLMIRDAFLVDATVARLKRALEEVTGVFVHSTIFWAPPDGGTKVHRDEVDTLAIQVRGSKTWLVSAERLDYPNHWNQISPGMGGIKPVTFKSAKEEPHGEALMREGDLLYVPKGQWHEVSTSDEESISLVFGFRPATARDILNVMIDYMSDGDAGLRTPTGVERTVVRANETPWQADRFGQAFRQAADFYRNGGHFEAALDWKRARFIGGMPPLEAKGGSVTSLGDKVRLADLAVCSVATNGPSAILSYPGDHLTAPAAFEPAFRFIAETEEFEVKELPGRITDGSKLKIVNRLLSCGVLEPCR